MCFIHYYFEFHDIVERSDVHGSLDVNCASLHAGRRMNTPSGTSGDLRSLVTAGPLLAAARLKLAANGIRRRVSSEQSLNAIFPQVKEIWVLNRRWAT
jgi:hypothetical protein